jgi:hypothetical protein
MDWHHYEPPDGSHAKPYDGGLYLVVTKTDGRGAAHKRVEIARYVEGWHIWPSQRTYGRKVTHWAELPSLPVDSPPE